MEKQKLFGEQLEHAPDLHYSPPNKLLISNKELQLHEIILRWMHITCYQPDQEPGVLHLGAI